jgi:membrane associated rhomboid family serine protease
VRDSLAAIGRDLGRHAATLLGLIVVLWMVHLANVVLFGGDLVRWGIYPRTVRGLPGVLVHPLVHGSWTHLLSNTVGLLVLGGMVMLREPRDFWIVSGLSLVIGGIGIWLFGRAGPHIGASGIVFGYFGYLLLTGWFDRRVGAIVLSVLTFLVWGRLLLGLSPLQRGISWEGHLFGLAGGVLGAWLRPRRKRRAG